MLYYDLDLGAWVRNPGSSSPPQMTPVLTIGGVFELPVQFIRGTELEDIGASSVEAVLKIAGDYTGDRLAEDNVPTTGGDGSLVFALDLTTSDAAAYFTANPTADTVDAAVQISYVSDSIERRVVPFSVVLQNDYLQS